MKQLTLPIFISFFLHIIIFISTSLVFYNNMPIANKTTYVTVSILQASKGNKAEVNNIFKDDITQKEEKNINKKVDTNDLGNIVKNKRAVRIKQPLHSTKKGSNSHSDNKAFAEGYASYIPKPSYPLISRRNKEEGTVVFNIYIDNKGHMIDYKIIKSSGYKRLDKQAEISLKSAKFQPAVKNGVPVNSNFNLKITFSLEGD